MKNKILLFSTICTKTCWKKSPIIVTDRCMFFQHTRYMLCLHFLRINFKVFIVSMYSQKVIKKIYINKIFIGVWQFVIHSWFCTKMKQVPESLGYEYPAKPALVIFMSARWLRHLVNWVPQQKHREWYLAHSCKARCWSTNTVLITWSFIKVLPTFLNLSRLQYSYF